MHKRLPVLRLSPVMKRFLVMAGLLVPLLFIFRENLTQITKLDQIADLHIGFNYRDGPPSQNQKIKEIRAWQRRSGLRKIVGFVFYGRRSQASILDCYLKRNLVKNGGILDEVVWLERTKELQDLRYLDKLIESEAKYSKVGINWDGDGYATSYDSIEDDIIYVKLDTDIVFIEDTTLVSMVHTRATRPDVYVVGANVINQPMGSWVHWNLGAIHPYLPEMEARGGQDGKEDGGRVNWRPSSLPNWDGAEEDFDMKNWTAPEGRQHRWLPLRNKRNHMLDKTPVYQTEYDAFGAGLQKWTIGAQQHYSFFENLERNELWRYRFETWNYQFLRMGLQFVVMIGKDINNAKPIEGDDEGYLAVTVPRRLGKSVVAAGGGVAAHYSFKPQAEGMGTTDVLERYRSYAQEKICRRGISMWTAESEAEAPTFAR